jgi:hypothetical protein
MSRTENAQEDPWTTTPEFLESSEKGTWVEVVK